MADGSYVAAALMPKAGSITFSAIPTGDDDLEAYMYQLGSVGRQWLSRRMESGAYAERTVAVDIPAGATSCADADPE